MKGEWDGHVCCNLEAMGPGSYTVSLDHGDEDGDVSQWTALSSSYTDAQRISRALWGKAHTHTQFHAASLTGEAFVITQLVSF